MAVDMSDAKPLTDAELDVICSDERRRLNDASPHCGIDGCFECDEKEDAARGSSVILRLVRALTAERQQRHSAERERDEAKRETAITNDLYARANRERDDAKRREGEMRDGILATLRSIRYQASKDRTGGCGVIDSIAERYIAALTTPEPSQRGQGQ